MKLQRVFIKYTHIGYMHLKTSLLQSTWGYNSYCTKIFVDFLNIMFKQIIIKQNNTQSLTHLTGLPGYTVTIQLPPKFQIIIFKAKGKTWLSQNF